jgi:hypothetical protein
VAKKRTTIALNSDISAHLTRFDFAEVDFNQFIDGLQLPSPYTLAGFTFVSENSTTLLIKDPAAVGGPPMSTGIAVGAGLGVIVKLPAAPDAISFSGVQMSANASASVDIYDADGKLYDTAPIEMNGKLTTDMLSITGLARRYSIFGVRANDNASWILSRILTNTIS